MRLHAKLVERRIHGAEMVVKIVRFGMDVKLPCDDFASRLMLES